MSASQGRVTRAGALPGASPVTRIAAGLQRRSELTRACLLSVALVVAMRVVLGAVLVVSCGDAHCNAQGVNWFGSAPASAGWQGLLVGPWDRNDAVYYAQIALHGYASPSAVLGPLGVFFPLFPLLARLALPVTAGDPILAGLLVNSVLAAVALVLMFELAKTDFGARAGYRAMLLLGAGPAAFFLLAPLSEAAFLALTLAAVLAARSGRGLLAGLIAVAATLTRDQGILVAVPLALIAGERARSRWRSGHLPLLWSDASLALAPLAYLGFQWYLGGHGYAGGTVAAERVYMHTQAAGPWTVLAESVQRVVTRADVAELVNRLHPSDVERAASGRHGLRGGQPAGDRLPRGRLLAARVGAALHGHHVPGVAAAGGTPALAAGHGVGGGGAGQRDPAGGRRGERLPHGAVRAQPPHSTSPWKPAGRGWCR
jgi:hypothetical protein